MLLLSLAPLECSESQSNCTARSATRLEAFTSSPPPNIMAKPLSDPDPTPLIEAEAWLPPARKCANGVKVSLWR